MLYNFLKKSHQAKNCSSERNCRHCKDTPSSVICDTLRETKRETKNLDNYSKITSAISYKVESKRNCVLLLTARAMAVDENRECCVPVRILLDTENLCSKLTLKAIRRKTLTLNSFGETRYMKQRCDRVKLHLQNHENSETVKISALKYHVI